MPSKSAFNYAIDLFFEKWESHETNVTQFLDHFKKEWVDKNSGWYEGFTEGRSPSTDNGLESVNGVIKKNHTLRERMSVSQYLTNAVNMIRNWSLDREETARCEKPFQDTPKIESSTWILAYNFLFKEK